MNPKVIHRRPTKFLRELYMQKHYQLELRGIETVWKKERLWTPGLYWKEENCDRCLAVKTWYMSQQKEGRLRGQNKQLRIKEYPNFAQLDFRTTMDQ